MIASIFDPIGLVGPVTVLAKYYMQLIWELVDEKELEITNTCNTGDNKNVNKNNYKKRSSNTLKWDDVLPKTFLEWERFSSQLVLLNQITIPRFLGTDSSVVRVEMHGFLIVH